LKLLGLKWRNLCSERKVEDRSLKGEEEVFVEPVYFKLAEALESFWPKLVVISGGRPLERPKAIETSCGAVDFQIYLF
jgi:hypothetical protein